MNLRWLLPDALVALAAVAAVVPAAREAVHWRWAEARNTTASWDGYVSQWERGVRGSQAVARHDELRWNEVRAIGRPDDLEAYADTARLPTHVAEARSLADEARYEAAKRRATIRSLQAYIDRYPEGHHATAAREWQARMRTDEAYYRNALERSLSSVNAKPLEEFLVEFPGHVKADQARLLAPDLAGRDLADLLREKKVVVTLGTPGAGQLMLSLRRTTAHPLHVKVPAGTGAVRRDGGVPAWVLLAPVSRVLDSAREQSLSTLAVMTQPDGWQRAGGLQLRAPSDPKLGELLDPQKTRLPPAALRAAVRVVVANATLAEVESLARATREGVASPLDLADALRVLHERGFDLRSRAIWRDRRTLIQRLPQGRTREWMEREWSGG